MCWTLSWMFLLTQDTGFSTSGKNISNESLFLNGLVMNWSPLAEFETKIGSSYFRFLCCILGVWTLGLSHSGKWKSSLRITGEKEKAKWMRTKRTCVSATEHPREVSPKSRLVWDATTWLEAATEELSLSIRFCVSAAGTSPGPGC